MAGGRGGGEAPSPPSGQGPKAAGGGPHVVVGRVVGLYGVRGWMRVHSYTEPRDGILEHSPWYLWLNGQWHRAQLESGRRHGKGLVAKLSVAGDRDEARRFVDAEIAIRRDQLPPTAPGEYYWVDLVGLAVYTLEGGYLGRVDHLMATGANDVLVVVDDRERLIPFIRDQVVHEVDLDAGWVRVDWDPDF